MKPEAVPGCSAVCGKGWWRWCGGWKCEVPEGGMEGFL
jgi:hypothetical protein